jgi:hypothetical protein
MTKMYLGDSVYANMFDGMIKLTTENESSEARNTIYLDYDTFEQLMRYASQAGSLFAHIAGRKAKERI